MNDYILKAIDELRKRGAIGATFAEGVITSVSFASPPLEAPTDEKPLTTHQRLLKSEREELAMYRQEREMAEELGNAP
jgi:hypothetical protein